MEKIKWNKVKLFHGFAVQHIRPIHIIYHLTNDTAIINKHLSQQPSLHVYLWRILHGKPTSKYLKWVLKHKRCAPKNAPIISWIKKIKVAHTRVPSVGFRSWSQFLAVSLQVTWVINPAVGCHYFPPGLQLPPRARGLLPISLLGEQRHNECEQFA